MNGRFKNPLAHYSTLTAIYGLGVATILYHMIFHSPGSYRTYSADCSAASGREVTVERTADGYSPEGLNLKLCDRIIFVNRTDQAIQPALGRHPDHTDYPGWKEGQIEPGQSKTLLLTTTGLYDYHDHLDERAKGHLSVTR
jgi:plastocyanin